MKISSSRTFPALLIWTTVAACGPDEPEIEVSIPTGATFEEVVDTLEQRDIVGAPGLFSLYARVLRADRKIKAGRYSFSPADSWSEVLGSLTRGAVVTTPVTIPEGFRIEQMAPRISEITHVATDSVISYLRDPDLPARLGVPGPTVEGYLFPDTYRFASGSTLSTVARTMADRYREIWTPERRQRLEALGMSERELVTLASIIQAEARHEEEMPLISGVYHRRLELGWLLQADPTVLYALGGPRERLLYAAIDSVEDNPYNTYRQRGLPPGAIGAPGERAIDAALAPEGDFLYFVARPDGTHVFTRSLVDHNRAKAESERLRRSERGGS